uniref:Uncharacterized protein n=1 Tax=Sphaeramia orbicularis TaxID=375764 RepID=A0A672ZSW1_9TELE
TKVTAVAKSLAIYLCLNGQVLHVGVSWRMDFSVFGGGSDPAFRFSVTHILPKIRTHLRMPAVSVRQRCD